MAVQSDRATGVVQPPVRNPVDAAPGVWPVRGGSEHRPSVLWSLKLPWRTVRRLRADGKRDGTQQLPDVVSPGALNPPTIHRLLCEGRESIAHERTLATREVAVLVEKAAWLRAQLSRARMDLADAQRDLDEGRIPQVDLDSRRPGEQHLASEDVVERRREDNLRLRAQAVEARERVAAVAADLLGRYESVRAQIRARVRVAQAAAEATHVSTLRQISIYAEGVVRAHPHGGALIQSGWPQLPPAPSWAVEEREALAIICGPGNWAASVIAGDGPDA